MRPAVISWSWTDRSAGGSRRRRPPPARPGFCFCGRASSPIRHGWPRSPASRRTAETAAVLRAELPPKFGRRQAWSFLFAALGGRPRPQQGLLIAKRFYEQIGGHSDRAVDPEADILRRISRRRIVTLSAAAICDPDA